MYDIFNEILGLFDPFTNDAGKYTAHTTTKSSTYFPTSQYVPFNPNEFYDMMKNLPSNINNRYIIMKADECSVPQIRDVIFNPPATIVIWEDGTKTVVKCDPKDTYSKETGLALAICKKVYGNKGSYNDVFNKWLK